MKFTLLLLCTILYSNIAFAQRDKFSNISFEGVLEKQAILSITQDTAGRLWFGGQKNIFYNNGNKIVNICREDTLFKQLDYINALQVNDNNDLFIVTRSGINVYNIEKRKLIKNGQKLYFANLKVHNIKLIDKKIYICASDGLYQAIPTKNSYIIQRILAISNPTSIEIAENKKYILASQKGVHTFTLEGKKIANWKNLKFPTNLLDSLVISTIYSTNDSIWLGTTTKGLFTYSFNEQIWRNYTQFNSNILSNNIRKITQDSKKRILIGTLKGLSIINNGVFNFTNYNRNTDYQYTLDKNSIYDIHIDRQANIWIGTYFGGLNVIYNTGLMIESYSSKPGKKNQLKSDVISTVAESKDYIWVATEEEGLSAINKITNQITSYAGLTPSDLIKDIYIKDEKIYIAQHAGGYSTYDIEKEKNTNYPSTAKLIQEITNICVDRDDNIYLGYSDGIYIVNHYKNTPITKIFKSGAVKFLVKDNQDNIYILTDKLYVKHRYSNEIKVVKSTKNLKITSIYSQKENLYFVTENAVMRLENDQNLSRIFKFETSSDSKIIVSNNIIWVGGANGLLYYNMNTKTENYLTAKDGLPVTNLSYSKLFISKEGKLYVPSINGLISFYPNQLKENIKIPTIHLETISGTTLRPIAQNRIKKQIDKKYTLHLKYDENNLNLDFFSDNLINPSKNKYKYTLKGFDKEWIETDMLAVKYTNLSAGKYNFIAYGSNNDNIWSTKPLQIEIIIAPPFWKTWYAYLLYTVVCFTLLHYVIKFIVEREILINSEKEHQKKISFFTQISHEIRTPLTLITAPIDDILDATKDNSEVNNKMHRLKNSANKLLGIVNELLDFKKIDVDKEALTLESIDIRSYLEDMFYLFSDLALAKQINFYIKQLDDQVYVALDRIQFDKVIFNLISNAIKYCDPKGTVFLQAEIIDNNYAIKLYNNGKSISDDNQFKIFDEYYRGTNAEGTIGTGIGLALAQKIVELHKGIITYNRITLDDVEYSEFTVQLPITKKNAIAHTNSYTIAQNELFQSKLDEIDKELILIVEDNIELNELIKSTFEDQFNILQAFDGQQGLGLATQQLPDLIITDLMMPNMDGMKMCELIKTNMATAHIPVVMLTANTNETAQLESLSYGSNIYMHKPFNSKVLKFTVINLINISAAKRKIFTIDRPDKSLSEVDLNFIKKLEDIIEQNILNPNFGVDFIAKEIGMSPPIVYKKLKALTNLSINNFVKQYRFKKAIILMKSEFNISEVAYQVGFSDRKYFSKEFKKTYGVSPSEYEENKEV